MDSDALLVRRALEGDERAMRMLWARHAAHVDAVVRRLVGDPDAAADVAQEVWIQIFRALPSWRGDSQFGTWAHRIAVNRTLNALCGLRRSERLETPLDVDDAAARPAATVEPDAERALLAASIDAAARQLAPGARQVFMLHDVEGWTHEEIAASLGITPGGSKSQLFKARARLRKLLAPLVDASPALPPARATAARHVTTSGAHPAVTHVAPRS